MNNFDDDLSRRLRGLADDMPGDPLPGPAAARRRGEARTRHQVIGGTLSAVAVGAIGAAIALGPPSFIAEPEPAFPEPTESESPEPPEATEATAIPDDALMTADDIWDYGGTISGDWRTAGPAGPDLACVPDLADLDAIDHKRIDYHSPLEDFGEGESVDRGPDDPMVSQDLVLVDPDASGDVFADLQAEIRDCAPPGEGETPRALEDSVVENVGDEAWIFRYLDPVEITEHPAGENAGGFVTVGLVRSADVISVTVRFLVNTEAHEPPDYMTPALAADRMCDEIFGSGCVTEPDAVDLEPVYPVDINGTEAPLPGEDVEGTDDGSEPELFELAAEPLLTDDDINPVGSYEGFTRSGTTEPSDEVYALLCLGEYEYPGVERTEAAEWFHEGEGSVTETVRQFIGHAEADGALAYHGALPDECGQVSDTHEQTIDQPLPLDVGNADGALAWMVRTEPGPDDPGSEPFFGGVAMARAGNIVIVVTVTASGDPTDGAWPAYATDVLGRAIDRALP